MIVFLCLFFVFSAFSQEVQWQYKVEGSFPTRATPNPQSPAIVNYTISWNESSTQIQGIYQDNYFTENGLKTVTGTVSDSGRTFNVILPVPVSGVRSLTFTTTQRGAVTGSISMRTETKDNLGTSVDEHAGFGLMTPALNPATVTNEDRDCSAGFGTLTNFCGIYNGFMSELNDPQNRCEVGGRSPRLELNNDMSMRIILDYVPGVTGLPTHEVGSLVPTPTSNSITVTRRDCTGLPATTFESGNCKTLALNGTFLNQPNGLRFIGTYIITDTINGDSCSYSLNLQREVAY